MKKISDVLYWWKDPQYLRIVQENYAETVAQQIVDDDPLAIACTMGWDEGAPPS